MISALIIEEVERGKNGDNEEKSKDNLIKLLSLLATLDDEETSVETSTSNSSPKIPGNRTPQQFASFQTSRPSFQTTRSYETNYGTEAPLNNNILSKPGPPYLSPTAFVNQLPQDLPPNVAFRPSEQSNYQTQFNPPKRLNAPKPNRPTFSETQNTPINSAPINSANEEEPNFLNQMINKLFNKNKEEEKTVDNLPSRPSNRPNQPQPLPYYPIPDLEKKPSLPTSPNNKYPSVDLVVGGVRPKPTKKKKKRKPQGNPSIQTYPIELPENINTNDESFSLPINSLLNNQNQFGAPESFASIGEQRTNVDKLDITSKVEEYPTYYPQSMFNTALPKQQISEPSPFAEERSSYKDALKNSLNEQLSQAWEIVRKQEEEQQRRQGAEMDITKSLGYDSNSDPEIIFVNVWKNTDGKLKLAGQKPMLKEKFDEMQRKKDFSKLASEL